MQDPVGSGAFYLIRIRKVPVGYGCLSPMCKILADPELLTCLLRDRYLAVVGSGSISLIQNGLDPQPISLEMSLYLALFRIDFYDAWSSKYENDLIIAGTMAPALKVILYFATVKGPFNEILHQVIFLINFSESPDMVSVFFMNSVFNKFTGLHAIFD